MIFVVIAEREFTHAGDTDAHDPTHERAEEVLETTERRGLGGTGLGDAIRSDHEATHLLFVELGVAEKHLDDQLRIADVLIAIRGSRHVPEEPLELLQLDEIEHPASQVVRADGVADVLEDGSALVVLDGVQTGRFENRTVDGDVVTRATMLVVEGLLVAIPAKGAVGVPDEGDVFADHRELEDAATCVAFEHQDLPMCAAVADQVGDHVTRAQRGNRGLQGLGVRFQSEISVKVEQHFY